MRKYISKLCLGVIVTVLLLALPKNLLNVEAADTTGPVITYMNIITYMDVDLVAGERMRIDITVDDASGLSDAVLVYKKVDGEGYLRLKAEKIYGNTDYSVNKFNCYFYIDKYAETGKYRPYLMYTYDGSSDKNMTKYIYSIVSETFVSVDKKQKVKMADTYIEVKQPKKFVITEYNASSFEEDWKSVKSGGTIVVKSAANNENARTLLPVDFLKYVKSKNITVIIPDWCGTSEIRIKGGELTTAQTKNPLKVFVRRQDLKYESLGSYGDEMYHEVTVKMSDKTVPFYLRITPVDEYLYYRGSFSTTLSKVSKNIDGEVITVTPIRKNVKFYDDDTIRKQFSEGLGAKTATFAISSKNNIHDFDVKLIKKASFTEQGKKELTCKKCGLVTYSYVDKVATVTLSRTSYLYDGSKKTPTVTLLSYYGGKLKKGTDYTVSYSSGRTKVGKYTVTIKLKGDYTGEKKVYFTIYMEEPKNLKAKLYGYNDVQLSWDAASDVDGYMVYRFDPYEKDVEKQYKLVGTTDTNFYKVANLKDDKSYQFAVKAYVNDGEDKVVSPRSDKVSVTTMGNITDVSVSYGGGNKVSIYWDGINVRDKYQISCSADPEETNVIATLGAYQSSYSYSPESNQKLYYKVRAYKVVDGKRIYTPWSDAVAYTLNKVN